MDRQQTVDGRRQWRQWSEAEARKQRFHIGVVGLGGHRIPEEKHAR
jgi:methylmalonyl-CoA mutase cobalamin-binding subunit